MRKGIIFIMLLSLLMSGCGAKNEPSTLKVAAAADLTLAFQEIGKRFEAKTGTPVVFSFGSTGQLAEQIENGAPFDVFAAANVQAIEKLTKEKLVVPETVHVYALGRIVIATKTKGAVQTLNDLLKDDIKKIAIANPDHAPYGVAAKQALQKAGIWEQVKPKIVYGKNIADTLAYVESGNAEAGIVALSLVKTSRSFHFQLINEAMHEPIQQAVAVMKATKHREAAKQFVAFLNSSEGREIMKKYGFSIPKEK
ncbi:molybdate ABC transporter substrate-binding protein [Anoxybacillus sp. J5B_2022]|uniref:molybdate ABC transporter substrate-binding protein n=1 Tax=Anoxybacillus sp. J5B_2022 TaxID=3003246 RepID=UPI002286BCC6|nr:molybdate ABC transporter substrate-binding protein [Anoxybacillus sp. J5B_2022]MCZ0756402.1 molybdate ABC transporter substrate-binding protein [Anoxybacillus sp. J5B_2022]